jgi:hypothetical protein
MDLSAAIKTLKYASTDMASLEQTDRGQLLAACSEFLNVAMPVERKITDWLFSVRMGYDLSFGSPY